MDVYWKACTDSAFRKKIAEFGEQIAKLEKAAVTDTRAGDALREKLLQFYLFCNNNPGLLVPHFFPNYPKPGRALSLVDRPFSFSMFNFQMGGWTVVRASRQIGKCLTFNVLCKIRHQKSNMAVEEKEISAGDLFSLACSAAESVTSVKTLRVKPTN